MVSDIYLPRVEGKDGVTPCIALLAGRPFGDAQSYVMTPDGPAHYMLKLRDGV